mmetsp:Transcript_42468/g.100296  ORF Transcript_42468/g.100296 Transcript_42468/m.100296 type:complete len:90 (-) Transcript_42468:292-561(-)
MAEAQGPLIPTWKGVCTICGHHVLSTQKRSQDENGYQHAECLKTETRDNCCFCGKPVTADQARGKDPNTGEYFHQECNREKKKGGCAIS